MAQEIKKSFVVKATFEKEVVLAQGVFYQHNIEMQNGDKGKYLSKDKVQKNFAEGKEVIYTYEKNTIIGKDGKEYAINKIKPYKQNPIKSQGAYYERPEVIRDITKAEMFHQAMFFAIAHKEKKLTLDDIKKLQQQLYKYCFQDTGENNPDAQKVMKRRTSIKLAIEYLQIDLVNSKTMIENANYIYSIYE